MSDISGYARVLKEMQPGAACRSCGKPTAEIVREDLERVRQELEANPNAQPIGSVAWTAHAAGMCSPTVSTPAKHGATQA